MKLACLVYLLAMIVESFSVIYSHDPSSLSLSCNPYGQDIKLQCTVQEPDTLTSPISFLILWYWSAIETNPILNGCQLYPNYQCSRFVGHSKYMFEFKRYKADNETREGGVPVMYRTLKLTIRNITSSDRGCYFCRPWIDMLPLNESSGAFCVKSESSYKHLTTCSKNEIIPTASGMISPSMDTSTPTESSVLAITPVLTATTTLDTSYSNHKHLGLWLYICIALCVLLIFVTLILSILTIAFGKRYFTKGKETPNSTHTARCNEVLPEYENRALPPLAAMNQPHFIGTYSYVRPHKDKSTELLADPLLSQYTKKTTDSTEEELVQSTLQTAESQKVSMDGHVSHIYQTLDEHIGQLETYMDENHELTQITQDSYDRLFDDPNYSPVCTSSTRPILDTSPGKEAQYDKLASKPTETSEYAYAYAHVAAKKQRKARLKTDPKPNEKSDEILRIAALGTYEMDPEFISTLQSQSEEVTFDSIHPPLPPPKVASQKARVVEGIRPSNCYQSLDHKTLAPNNSYTALTKSTD